MVLVQVGKLQTGDQLMEDVFTHKGNKLFHKGKILTERDIEVLKAFMVVDVIVDRSASRKVDSYTEQETRMPRRAKIVSRMESELESDISKHRMRIDAAVGEYQGQDYQSFHGTSLAHRRDHIQESGITAKLLLNLNFRREKMTLIPWYDWFFSRLVPGLTK